MSEAQIHRAILAFVNAETLDEVKRCVEMNCEVLLTDTADQLLTEWLVQAADNEGVSRRLRDRQALLEHCRREGINTAFTDRIHELDAPQYISSAEYRDILCSCCRTAFHADVWILVDMIERPDLAERVRHGTLHVFACPRCGETVEAEAPLLLYLPEESPLLIFSPVESTTVTQGGQQVSQLVDLLRQRLGGAWQDEWFDEGFHTVPRALLPEVLDGELRVVLQQLKVAAPLPHILARFVRSNTWDEAQQIVADYPELLGDEATTILEEWIDHARELGDSDLQHTLREHHSMLRNWREVRGVMTSAWDISSAEPRLSSALQTILRNIAEAEQAGDLPGCIQACQQALTLVHREHDAVLWATLHMTLGQGLANNSEGLLADNIEQAIHHYHQTLRVFTHQTYPDEWATTQKLLATSYWNRSQGERADNLEKAIDHYQQALEVYTRQAYCDEWGQLQLNLGALYLIRTTGERADNLEKAVFHCQRALDAFTPESYPEQWAATHGVLMIAYTDRIRGERADNLEQALKHFHQALKIHTRQAFPADWGAIQNNLVRIYLDRIRGERAENLELAIKHCNQAIEVYSDEQLLDQWAGSQTNLANAYLNRIRGERADNLEKAIYHYHLATEIHTRESFPVEWAGIQTNLGNAYAHRIRGDQADNLEQAIFHCQQALEVYTRPAFPHEWAATQMILGSAYAPSRASHRPHWGEGAENTERAIHHYQQSLEVYTHDAFPERWAAVHHNLGGAYYHRVRGARADSLEQAIHHCQQALEVYTRHTFPFQWASTFTHLGNVYRNRLQGVRIDNLEYAIHCFHRALEVYTLDQFPALHRLVQGHLGNLYFNEGDWEQAHAAYTAATQAGEALLGVAYTEAGRQAEVAVDAHFFANHALSLLHLRQPAEALLRLEQGKTRLLAESLVLDESNLAQLPVEYQHPLRTAWHTLRDLETECRLPQDTPARRTDHELAESLRKARVDLKQCIETVRNMHPTFMPPDLDLSSLLALIPPGGVLVVPLITDRGSAVFVLPHGSTTVSTTDVVLIETFTTEDLRTILYGPADTSAPGGWLGAYMNARKNPNGWFEVIDDTGGALWDALMGPVHMRVSDLGLAVGAPVRLMPQGGLSLLPLHTAWRAVDGVRHAFLDDYTVSYVPSGAVLSVAQRRLMEQRRQQRSLLAVVNPTSNLDFAFAEGEAVAALFDPVACQVLAGAAATAESVVEAVRDRTYLHFSCHGFHVWQDPLRSGLLLAGNTPFTLAEIIARLDLSATRLVTLSACETGLIDIRQAPDEYLGLPIGFMQAGAPGVVSTLWAVDDHATSMLMERFYRLHICEGLHPSQALRHAQLWLHEVTYQGLRTGDRFIVTNPPERPEEATVAAHEGLHEDKPYAHPRFWAAFTFTGV